MEDDLNHPLTLNKKRPGDELGRFYVLVDSFMAIGGTNQGSVGILSRSAKHSPTRP